MFDKQLTVWSSIVSQANLDNMERLTGYILHLAIWIPVNNGNIIAIISK